MDQASGTYTSVWDINLITKRGYEISSPCTIDLEIGLIYADISDDAEADVDILDRAYVTIADRNFSVVRNDEDNHRDLHVSDLDVVLDDQ